MSDSFLTRAERHARWWDVAKKTAGGIAAVAVVVGAVARFTWDWARSSVIEQFARQIDPACLRPPPEIDEKTGREKPQAASLLVERLGNIDARIEKLEKRVEDPKDPYSKIGGQLDNIQRMLDEQQKKRTTPPPVVGPTATGQGRQ